MSCPSKDCAAHFKARPAYHRLLALLFRKYESYGRTAGTICLPDATPEECEVARDLFGRPFSAPLRIRAADFEAALQQTPYRGASLKEVLECYFSKKIQTARELREQTDAQMAQLLDRAEEAAGESCRRWLAELAKKRGSGYTLLRKALTDDAEAAGQALLQVCRSADLLEKSTGAGVRLAVLSANATSDPHALDSGTLAGKLFLHLLSAKMGVSFPSSAEQRDALYYECGLLCDSISSTVTQIGLRLYLQGEEHAGYRAFRLGREPVCLTLMNLTRLTGADSPSGKVYLVENQMVFSQLCDEAARFHSPLICTSGQPAVAVFRLLDLLAAAGTRMFYSGDFDGKGLSIAAQLLARYRRWLEPWHMTPADYARCRSDIPLEKGSSALLTRCADSPLAQTADAVHEDGHAGYQELLLPELLMDLISTSY